MMKPSIFYMPFLSSFRSSVSTASRSIHRIIPTKAPILQPSSSSSFSTSRSLQAGKSKKRSKNAPVPERRITFLRAALHKPTTRVPPTLNFSRLRYLRHWTITRAWSLYAAKRRAAHQLELERQWTSMRAACEELRTGVGDGGRLFRQAMNKKGTWGGRSDLPLLHAGGSGEAGRVERGREGGIPLEYARGLTDSPPRNGWDENWTR